MLKQPRVIKPPRYHRRARTQPSGVYVAHCGLVEPNPDMRYRGIQILPEYDFNIRLLDGLLPPNDVCHECLDPDDPRHDMWMLANAL